MSSPPGAIQRLWFKWKAIRLPWRKRWLAGADLSGNTFWEFKDTLSANRLRRIVQYNPKTHYSDVKIDPQWHQWLRHTRPNPPSIQEQQYEVARQIQIRQLAAEADARWKSIPSFLDSPDKQQPAPAIASKSHVDAQNTAAPAAEAESGSARQQARPEGTKKRDKGEKPWKQINTKAPGEDFQPQSWSPGVAKRS